ncbi:MAG: plasmid pRiA4b ORF-3 family protein [Candidatus Marinimicrobia bacterium]|nr:plasmid pRiA4b ORF-3 family protein [Candidatus Neomarinimicrobiota bacterium]MBL7010829.1 plasmid pRiA4b ORF-3 family protein [Candidatus Neomarinimicrobiota bacterium]MBL7030123.1 plasmid pRiA4b ORF-3 family protein [Candidatus Neomarinimicrobiota bacterium]
MKNKTYQIQIALKNFKPKIWRRVLIPSDLLLPDFHKIIQTSMGWSNGHLHQFTKDHIYYSLKTVDSEFWDEQVDVDYTQIKVSDLLIKEKGKILYEYDFGDDWEHDITLEKILPHDPELKIPVCLKGKMNCPPENCGGVWNYAKMLESLGKPKQNDYSWFFEFIENHFDPEYFNVNEINEMLKTEDYGCFNLMDEF